MPRRPSKRCRLLKFHPLTFSSFSRFLLNAASLSYHKRLMLSRRFYKKVLHDGKDDALRKQFLKEKKEQPDLSEDDELNGVIHADFEFFDPKPDDFHGAKILLQSYLDDKEWQLSSFVDLVLAQNTVGTVVKVADDEDDAVFSIITALNMGRYKDHECIREIKDFLLNVSREDKVKYKLESLFGDDAWRAGLLISQRVLNLPPQLLPPLYDALFDEISWATEDEPAQELRNSFGFKTYMLVTRVYKLKDAGEKKKSTVNTEEETIYVKPEDEIFHNLCSWSHMFPLHNHPVVTPELRNYRLKGLVMAVEANKIPEFRKQLKLLIDMN